MRFSPRSLPHPVLNNGDDVLGFAFQAKFEADCDKQNYYLKIEFHLSHPDLLTLIAERKAQFVVHVECGTTLFRERFSFSKETETIAIKAESLRDRVEVNFFICAIDQITNYQVQGAQLNCHGGVCVLDTLNGIEIKSVLKESLLQIERG